MKPIQLLGALCLVLFIALCFRQYPIGVDSYDYLSFVYGQEHSIQNKGAFIEIFFSLFPRSFIFWNALAVLCLFGSCYFIGKMGSFFSPVYGDWASLIAFSTTIFPLQIIQFEPESIGMVFLLASAYYFFKNNSEPSTKNAVLLGIGTVFWKGGALVALGFGLYSMLYLIPSIVGVVLNFNEFIAAVFPNFAVLENYPIYGLFVLLIFFWCAIISK